MISIDRNINRNGNFSKEELRRNILKVEMPKFKCRQEWGHQPYNQLILIWFVSESHPDPQIINIQLRKNPIQGETKLASCSAYSHTAVEEMCLIPLQMLRKMYFGSKRISVECVDKSWIEMRTVPQDGVLVG